MKGAKVILENAGPAGSEVDLSPLDRVILVIGMTGVGKSTFIHELTGLETGIGESLLSQTAVVSRYRYGKEIVLLDTPGLDDSQRSDAYVLAALGSWLAASYSRGITIAGVLYLHRINDPRMTGSAFKRLNIYLELLGHQALARTIIVTTQWPHEGDDTYRTALAREEELTTDPKLLQSIVREGAKTMRFLGSEASAANIIASLPGLSNAQRWPALQIQHQLVTKGVGLQKTAAGRLVAESAQEMIEFYELTMKKNMRIIKDAQEKMDADSTKRIKAAEDDNEFYKGLLANTKKEQNVLAIKWKGLVKGIVKAFRLVVR